MLFRSASGLLLVEGAEAGVVLRAGLAQLQVLAHDADDVHLLLDELGEVVGHGYTGAQVQGAGCSMQSTSVVEAMDGVTRISE